MLCKTNVLVHWICCSVGYHFRAKFVAMALIDRTKWLTRRRIFLDTYEAFKTTAEYLQHSYEHGFSYTICFMRLYCYKPKAALHIFYVLWRLQALASLYRRAFLSRVFHPCAMHNFMSGWRTSIFWVGINRFGQRKRVQASSHCVSDKIWFSYLVPRITGWISQFNVIRDVYWDWRTEEQSMAHLHFHSDLPIYLLYLPLSLRSLDGEYI